MTASCDVVGVGDAGLGPSAAPGSCNTGGGTGVFIPACILDGSALTNPAIASKFARRPRRGGGGASADAKGGGAGKGAAKAGAPPAAPAPAQAQAQAAQQQPGGGHQPSASAAAAAGCAKNPFAATPKNIRQQQLLCNLVAAADCFSEASAVPLAGQRASLELPPAGPGARASLDAGAALPRVASRSSMDSSCCGWGGPARSSCDLSSARPSCDSYAASMRSSLDHAGSWSGRPSVDSTFSCYAAAGGASMPPLPPQQAAARASFESALPPSGPGSRLGAWPAGRSALDLGACARPPASAFGAAGAQRSSLDSADCHAAAAAAAANALQWQQVQQQQQQQQQAAVAAAAARGLMRRDSSSVSSLSNSSNPDGCPPSPATPAELAAAAAAAAQRSQAVQLQALMDGLAASGAAEAAAAALASSGLLDPSALLYLQAQAAAAMAGGAFAPTVADAAQAQAQLAQLLQANQLAAAAAAAAAAALPKQQLLGQAPQWQALQLDAGERDMLVDSRNSSLDAAVSAACLQQQLDMLQLML